MATVMMTVDMAALDVDTILRLLDPLQPSLHEVQEAFSELRELLCNKLHVDPLNFRLLGNILITMLASRFGKELTSAYHHAFHKLVRVVAHALAAGPTETPPREKRPPPSALATHQVWWGPPLPAPM
ncbi:hemoglobin subunit beta-1-like [Podarcis muralis]